MFITDFWINYRGFFGLARYDFTDLWGETGQMAGLAFFFKLAFGNIPSANP